MLDGWWKGKLAGSGMIVWEGRRLLAEGKIDYEEFISRVCASAPSLGHCNTMGTASTMNALAEALGMSLLGVRQYQLHLEKEWLWLIQQEKNS